MTSWKNTVRSPQMIFWNKAVKFSGRRIAVRFIITRKIKMVRMLDRKKAPEIVDAVNFDLHLKTAGNFKLDNGVPVYTIHAGAEDVLSLEWVFYAGNWHEDKNLVAASTNFLLRNGTSTRTAFQ